MDFIVRVQCEFGEKTFPCETEEECMERAKEYSKEAGVMLNVWVYKYYRTLL